MVTKNQLILKKNRKINVGRKVGRKNHTKWLRIKLLGGTVGVKKASLCTRNSTIEKRIIELLDFLNTRDFITKSISVNFISKRAIILRDEAGWVNMTQLAKFFGKRWRDWVRWNKNVIKFFESLERKALIRTDGQYRLQSYVHITLAVRVLSNWSEPFLYYLLSALNSIKKKLLERISL